MFRRFRETLILLFIVMFSSCSYPDENIITLTLPTHLPIVDISGESPYMDAYIFDGERTYHRFIRSGETEITVPVKKGVMSLFTLKPYGKYSSVSAYLEPDMESCSMFSPVHSQLIEFYTDIASRNPDIIANTSMTTLIELYPETDGVDKMKLLEFLEKGPEGGNPKDDGEDGIEIDVPDLSAPLHEIAVDTYIPGLWRSDRADMEDFHVSYTADELVLELHEGVYHYFHEDGGHHMMIVVTMDGKHTSRLDYPVW